MKPINHITNTYYESWEKLLELIDQKLDFYLRIFQIFMLLKDCGLRPGYMLDVTHPAYFSDAVAMHCLATYDPQEPMDPALERCITDKLHWQIECMNNADLCKVRMGECIWEQFSLDALLRLAWRHKDGTLQIPFYLQKETQTGLSDPFLLEVHQGCIRLTQCTHNRLYEINLTQMDIDTFCQQMYRNFQLATEDYGYFVPAFVWLSLRAMKRG